MSAGTWDKPRPKLDRYGQPVVEKPPVANNCRICSKLIPFGRTCNACKDKRRDERRAQRKCKQCATVIGTEKKCWKCAEEKEKARKCLQCQGPIEPKRRHCDACCALNEDRPDLAKIVPWATARLTPDHIELHCSKCKAQLTWHNLKANLKHEKSSTIDALNERLRDWKIQHNPCGHGLKPGPQPQKRGKK